MAKHYSIATRAEVVTLALISRLKYDQISTITGVPKSTIGSMVKHAKDQGFEGGCLLDEHVADKPRPGRPKSVTPEVEEKILESVRKNRAGREKTLEFLAYEAGISRSACHRVLKEHGFNKVKPTWKPGLSDEAKQKRLEFCKAHQHWTLEDWKNVIWSDETSVVLGHRRGAQRVWRTAEEATDPTCVRRRWKGSQEFMFWGCFSYDKKGPCHIYVQEPNSSKRHAEEVIEEMNKSLEQIAKKKWDMEQEELSKMERLQARKRRGRPPTFKFSPKNGKLVRKSKGGVDWWRHLTVRLVIKTSDKTADPFF